MSGTELASNGRQETIVTTPEHPFYLLQSSHSPIRSKVLRPELSDNWVGAGHLNSGDLVRGKAGETLKVVSAKTVVSKDLMYNLQVANNHTFFVGDFGALTHNTNVVEYGTGLSVYALKRRLEDKAKAEKDPKKYSYSTRSNYAVIKVKGYPEPFVFVNDNVMHAEARGVNTLQKMGLLDDIEAIYSEREPCNWGRNCDAMLRSKVPDVPLYHSFPFNVPPSEATINANMTAAAIERATAALNEFADVIKNATGDQLATLVKSALKC